MVWKDGASIFFFFTQWRRLLITKGDACDTCTAATLLNFLTLRAFNFLLDGDVRLSIPDFITHEKDLANADLDEGSDASTDEEMCL
jgi:hypothetical protein